MKCTSIDSGTGKVGARVFSRVHGQLVAREYVSQVSNPQTTAQTTQRARMKLASQLAAALAPVIAIPRDGMKSPRNIFVKNNFQYIVGTNGAAQISYENIQLTVSSVGLPGINVSRSEEDGIVVKLRDNASAAVDRVVYVLYRKTSEDQLQYIGSDVQAIAGDNGDFQTSFSYLAGDIIVWAYGMKDITDKARTNYGNYNVETGLDIAQLVYTRNLSASDFQFTQTRGITLFSDESETIEAGEGQSMVYVTATEGGTATAPGLTNGRMAVNNGTNVTFTATPNEGYRFAGWRLNGESSTFSSDNPLTMAIANTIDLVAVFESTGGGLPSGGGQG